MSKPRDFSHRFPPPAWREVVEAILLWRPRTVLAYLLMVAMVGILIAVAVILGVELHLFHRLT